MKNMKTEKAETIKAVDVMIQNAAGLLSKHPEYEEIIIANYGKRVVQMTEGGSIDFNPDGLKDVVKGEKLTYNDYIEAQINAVGKVHSGFQWCFYNIPLGFMGQVQEINDKFICFRRIFIVGSYYDGIFAVKTEQHVWMDLDGFEGLKKGDCVKFSAGTYRYLKTGNGKQIDYGIRNPSGVKKIEMYELPTDDDLLAQELDLLFCEACYLYDSCSKNYCVRGRFAKETKKAMKNLLKMKYEQ